LIFQWAEKLREILQSIISDSSAANEDLALEPELETEREAEDSIEIIHGEIIMDRKSTFQGHVATVKFPEDVK
jgi:hypothetical protein